MDRIDEVTEVAPVTVFFDAMVVTAPTSRPQCIIGTQISGISDEA